MSAHIRSCTREQTKYRYRVVEPRGRPAEWAPVFQTNRYWVARLYAWWYVATNECLGVMVQERVRQ